MKKFTPIAALLILAPLVLSGCLGKEEAAAPSVTPTFGSLYTNFFGKDCKDCHNPAGSATVTNLAQVDFTSQATAYTTLTSGTVKGITSTGVCGTVNLVSATFPEKSYLAGILFDEYYKANNFADVSGCAPYNVHLSDMQPKFDATAKAALVQWIKDGALNN